MRKYYIFNINKAMSILAKDSPYMLYKSFETIYNSNKKEINIAQNLYEQLAMRLNQNVINQKIYAEYKDNDYYYLVNNTHNYYNCLVLLQLLNLILGKFFIVIIFFIIKIAN